MRLSFRAACLATPRGPSSFSSLPGETSPSALCFRTEPPTNPDRAFRGPLPPRLPLLPLALSTSISPAALDTFAEIVVADLTQDERWDPVSLRPPINAGLGNPLLNAKKRRTRQPSPSRRARHRELEVSTVPPAPIGGATRST